MLLKVGKALANWTVSKERVQDEDARGERKGKGFRSGKYFRIIKGGIDSKNSEGRREF
jgi:hypothetical protein